MDIVQDDGGEHLDLDALASRSLVGMPDAAVSPSQLEKTFIEYGGAYEDDVEGPDEKSDSPALYLRKFWRKVSVEPVSFDCFRSPKTRSYACTLKLSFPQKEPRVFRSPPVYASKREAIRALADYAMQCGILGEAARSMALLDKSIDPYELPGASTGPFDGSSNPRFAPPGDVTSHQTPVTLLNLAVQKYCVEVPNVVLDFVHQMLSPQEGRLRGAIYRCELRLRISHDVHETYATTNAFPSTRLAKEAVAQLALQEGVVILFKLHNSMTTKICRQLGTTIPATLEDHDTFEEENTAGLVSQLVQQITRDPGALTATFSEMHSDTAHPLQIHPSDLYGARVMIRLSRDDTRTYEMPPLFRNKKEAKECVCRLAVRLGLRKDLESRMNLVQASHQAIDGLSGPVGGPSGLPLHSTPTDNAISRLNILAQTTAGGIDCLVYEFTERPGASILGKSMTIRFGSSLTVRLKPDVVQKFESDTVFPSKKLAKEAVANLAVRSILASKSTTTAEANSSSRASPSIGGSQTATTATTYNAATPDMAASHAGEEISHIPHLSTSYQAPRNVRVQDLPVPKAQEFAYVGPPPPYMASSPARMLAGPSASASVHLTIPSTSASALKTSNSGGQQPSNVFHNSSQPNLQVLRQHFSEAFGADGASRIAFHLRQDQRSGLYDGTLRLDLQDGDVRVFHSDGALGSVASAKESLSIKALSGNLWKQLSLASQQPEAARLANTSISQANAGTRPYHLVSYVHQMCQILLGTEPRHKPDFEVFKPGNGRRLLLIPLQGNLAADAISSAQFAASLTIPTVPAKTYTCSVNYDSKAAAREAVAALSIEEGLVDYLKAHGSSPLPQVRSKGAGIAHKSASLSDPPFDEMMVNVPPPNMPVVSKLPQAKRSYVDRLRSYCQETELPDPVFQKFGSDSAIGEMNRMSVTIGQKVYELEAQGDQPLGSEGHERLAKRLLKHFVAQEAQG